MCCFLGLHLDRDTAKGVKADVDSLLGGFGSVEQSLSVLEDKIQTSMDLIENLNNNILKVRSSGLNTAFIKETLKHIEIRTALGPGAGEPSREGFR